ncbi:MAG: DegV family protein [Eubacterium sp.]|nr:DegV family protein [Eubacterium sp.]
MSDFVLTCCSTVDLTNEYLKERNIPYVSFHVQLGEDTYADDMGQSISQEELFRRMLDGEDAKTSQVTVQQYIDFFKGFLDEGKDILHLCLSSGLSGTYNSACVAAEDLKEEYPDRKIYTIDTLAASSGFGLIVDTLADMRDNGADIEELKSWIDINKKRMHHWFFTTDLTFFIKGGRVSKTSGLVGNLLGICPLLNVDMEGKLIPREKVRGKKKVIKRTLDRMIEHAENGTDYSGKCFISQAGCYDDAKALADKIEETFPNLNGKVEIFPIGATIGGHTGPGTVALFFWGDERVD